MPHVDQKMTSLRQRFGSSNNNYKHGMTKTRMYRAWKNMLSRCRDPENIGYKNYGGRGISVCERWLSFVNFYADMGERPQGMQIERNDNDGPYSPENCRWATVKEQGANRRTNRFLVVAGERVIQLEAAARLGLSHCAISARRRRGWSGNELTQPRVRRPFVRLSSDDEAWLVEWHRAGWPTRLLGLVVGCDPFRVRYVVHKHAPRRADDDLLTTTVWQ